MLLFTFKVNNFSLRECFPFQLSKPHPEIALKSEHLEQHARLNEACRIIKAIKSDPIRVELFSHESFSPPSSHDITFYSKARQMNEKAFLLLLKLMCGENDSCDMSFSITQYSNNLMVVWWMTRELVEANMPNQLKEQDYLITLYS
ncbi:CLUMA_CG010395, isoform A [Clunio marinus]|uniref:CLUMA_CG010395, isoform A n=1 Tax=Clunio marinus TaxID=568069 RepID=A0A1J1I9N2_9DIPT|nr:CLUMA_CG010395, isoform A [Clunio marinus]